jgi:hypothetical protein
MCFPNISYGNFYNKLRRLIIEGCIVEKKLDDLSFDVIHLTKKGFDLIKYDLGELKEQRFNPQSVTHDYWASVFQLGYFVGRSNITVTQVTEQEIQSKDPGILPPWVPITRDHVPDGLFEVGSGESSQRFGIEVELNLKPPIRYDKAAYYFDLIESKIDVVFWLCGNLSIMKWIFQRQQKAKLFRPEIHHFLLTDDFKINGWNAKARAGQFRGKTIQEIYLLRSYVGAMKDLLRSYEDKDSEILFPKTKSSWKQRG